MAKKSARTGQPVQARAAAPLPRAAPHSAHSDKWLVYGTVPLRLFLGVTFVYAGLQKISDPGFLDPSALTYIGTQLQGFVNHSPIGFAIQWLALPIPQLTGIGVIATELTIGALVLMGLATRWAGAAGAALSFVLFLTASWTVQPYFLGSDSIYTVAWITLVLVGDQGVLTAWPFIRRQLGIDDSARPRTAIDMGRRRALVQIGGAAVAFVWVLAVLPRSRPTPLATTNPTPATSPTPVVSPTGTRIGALADLQSQGSLTFSDPATGDPAVAIQLAGGSVVAFDALCTHAGCTVSYDASQKLIVCPCHGGAFDPANGAAVVAGPPPTPLGSIKVQVATDGGVYAG